MPLVTDKDVSIFKLRTIWFEERPYDVKGVDSLCHMYCREKVDERGFARESLSTLVLDLTGGSDPIWSGMDNDCRKYIRRAEKEGFRVNLNTGQDQFLQMNKDFRRTKNLSQYEYSEEFVKNHGTLFTAELNGDTLCCYLAIHDDRTMRGLQAVSTRFEVDADRKKMIGFGNRLLVWEAIRYAESKGIGEFDLGGYYVGERPDAEMEGINRFKRGFGGQLVERHSYLKDYSIPLRLTRKAVEGWNRIRYRKK